MLAVLCLAACKKDDTILNQFQSFGDVGSEVIYGDNGISFRITKVSCDDGYKSNQRVMFTCNVLKKVSEREYEAELLAWQRVLKKDVLKSSTIADPDAVGKDPIKIQSIWASGLYLNMEILTTFIKDSDTKHIINLVLDEDACTEDTLHFTLRHNGNGESVNPGSSDLTFDDVVLGRSLVSFPVQDFIPRGKAMKVVIDWEWHITEDGVMSPLTETNSSSGIIHSLYSN